MLVITRWHVELDDVEQLEHFENLKLTILVTWSGIEDNRIEPVDSGIAERSLKALNRCASRVKSILYWRPIIAGLNDTDRHFAKALELAWLADAAVFTGLFYRDEIRSHFEAIGVPDLYGEVARRKVLPANIERRVLDALGDRPLFRKTSCGVAYAHGVPDYNGHYGIREICDICPSSQVALCASVHRKPDLPCVQALAVTAGLEPGTISIDERRVEVARSTEQQRYFMQHSLNFQVHDRKHPHLYGRHGRAELGWN